MDDRAAKSDVVAPRGWRDKVRSPATAVAALALYGLLADAAVETWRSGTAVRVWVAGPIALYVGYTLWILRQPSADRPPARASMWLSLFLLLGVLALTATMPGGMSDGVRVARLGTPAVFTVSAVAVLLLAFVSFAFSRDSSPVLRALGAAGAAYGAGAFAWGLARGVDYTGLLQGRSLPESLPYFLQGAFIGALVVVPLAFAREVVYALTVLRVRGRLYRLVAFALGTLIAYYAFTAGRG